MSRLQVIQNKIKELKLYKDYLLKLDVFNKLNKIEKNNVKVRKR